MRTWVNRVMLSAMFSGRLWIVIALGMSCPLKAMNCISDLLFMDDDVRFQRFLEAERRQREERTDRFQRYMLEEMRRSAEHEYNRNVLESNDQWVRATGTIIKNNNGTWLVQVDSDRWFEAKNGTWRCTLSHPGGTYRISNASAMLVAGLAVAFDLQPECDRFTTSLQPHNQEHCAKAFSVILSRINEKKVVHACNAYVADAADRVKRFWQAQRRIVCVKGTLKCVDQEWQLVTHDKQCYRIMNMDTWDREVRQDGLRARFQLFIPDRDKPNMTELTCVAFYKKEYNL